MADADLEITRALADVNTMRTFVGTMVRLENGRAIVDVGGGRIPAALATGVIPRPADEVHVWFINGKPFVMGWSSPKPTSGVIATTGTDVVTVTTDLGSFAGVPYLGDQPSSGDIVSLAWGENGPVVVGISSLTPDEPPVAPDVPPAVQQRVEVFTATGSGSAANGKAFRSSAGVVYASASQIGVYTYGSKVRDSLAGAAGVDKVEVYLAETRDSGNLPLLGTHPLEAVAGTTPAISNLRSIARPFGRWVDISDLGPTLRGGGGVGFDGAGFAIFTGIGSDPNQAGALRITYRK